MKSLKRVLQERPDYATLIRSVINNLGIESVRDVNRHGIDGGFGNFIYYTDTVKFYKRHKNDIMRMAEEMADEFGEGVLEMIQGFNCLGKDHYSIDEIGKAIYSGRGEMSDQILNAMAWFAAEEVCRMFEN